MLQAKVHLVVFLAHNPQMGLVAAKVIRSYSFDEQEWEAAGKLQTGEPIPFIVNFVAAKKFDEFSVDHIIKQKAVLSGGTIRAISKQLFEGLHLIHSKGLVHRDIKGENIMLHCPFGSNRVVVKIADFGLVKVSGGVQQTMLMSSKGTPLNMAPELVNGDGKADAKVDVWSAGVV
ncbi:MAG: hypothetical protein EZS28_032479, partial [Streblomastix strix]